jgi:predicted membrane-bound mannosyltransferase
MSVAELPPRVVPSPVDPAHAADRPRRLTLSLEQAAYLGLFVLALLAHLWALGDRALHHDETLHASVSWSLFMGQGFTHDPLLHGPFLYYLNALIYFLFGDNDYTARLGVALFGSVLVVLPYLIRRELGRGAALLAAVYLLISPAFLYVGRFIRHDMYAVTFELLTFISIVRYLSTRDARWLYLGAAAMGLMFTTIETFFLYSVIFGSLIGLTFLWRIWRPGIAVAAVIGLAIVALVFVLPGKPQRPFEGSDEVVREQGMYVCPTGGTPPPDNPILYTPGPLLGLGPLATSDNNYALCVRHQADNSFGLYFAKLGQFFGHPAILLGLVVTVIGGAALYALIWRRRGPDGMTPWERARASSDSTVEAFASLALGWRAAAALGIAGTIYTLFFTAFFTNPVGIVSGTTGSLLYWLAQHGVQRGGQPRYYYLVLLAIYEPLALLWSIIGLVMIVVLVLRRARGRTRAPSATPGAVDWGFVMPVMLAWWVVATVALYSWAGEKMPWLTIHVALPLVLLGAWTFARVLRWSREVDLPRVAPAVPLAEDAGDLNSDDVWEPSRAAGSNGYQPALPAPAAPMELRPLFLYLGIFGTIAAFFFLWLSIFAKPDGQQIALAGWWPFFALLLVFLLTFCAATLRGVRWALGALALGITLVGGLYSVRSAYQLSYRWGDIPREMMIYTQTSPDVARVIGRLEEAATRRGGELAMPVWYDNETVWDWYMRRFINAQEQPPALTTPPGDDVMAVLMLQENLDAYPQNVQSLQGFRIQRYPLRWWFPEEMYRMPSDWATAPVNQSSPLLMRLLRNPIDAQTSAELWQFLIYRKPPLALGSTDFVIAIRPELADEIGLGTGEQK